MWDTVISLEDQNERKRLVWGKNAEEIVGETFSYFLKTYIFRFRSLENSKQYKLKTKRN